MLLHCTLANDPILIQYHYFYSYLGIVSYVSNSLHWHAITKGYLDNGILVQTNCTWLCYNKLVQAQIAKFMEPTWGPPGSCRPQIGPMLAPWTLLLGVGGGGEGGGTLQACFTQHEGANKVVIIPRFIKLTLAWDKWLFKKAFQSTFQRLTTRASTQKKHWHLFGVKYTSVLAWHHYISPMLTEIIRNSVHSWAFCWRGEEVVFVTLPIARYRLQVAPSATHWHWDKIDTIWKGHFEMHFNDQIHLWNLNLSEVSS